MHISETTVKRPVLAAVLSLFVILIGLASYDKLTIREYPDIDRPVVTVTTVYLGASSKILERDVTEIIEDSLSGISGIREITSESRDELSKIRIEFTLETDLDTAANDVRDKVSRVAALLPAEAESPRIAKSDSDARAIMWIGFSSDLSFVLLKIYTVASLYKYAGLFFGSLFSYCGHYSVYAMD